MICPDQLAGGADAAQQSPRRSWQSANRWEVLAILLAVMWFSSGCGDELATPTRTPVPTWTPTPVNGAAPAAQAQQVAQAQPATATEAPAPPTATFTPEPPTATQAPTDTPLPTDTPTPAITDTPTAPPPPTPTPTSAFQFQLEAAEKFPTDSLAVNVVRIYLYVYSPAEFGLPGYRLSVIHNGTPLTVDEVSTGGLPDPTRLEPSPYTRFTNLNVVFVEPQAGRWEIQLIDNQGNGVGPMAPFDLTADERTRELYVRYKQK